MEGRIQLKRLIEAHFGGENAAAAQALTAMGKAVSERTIQAWLIDPSRRSSRNLPPWVVPSLEDYISDPKNKASLALIAKRPRLSLSSTDPKERAAKIRDTRIIELADAAIEADEHRLQRWEATPLPQLPSLIAALEATFDDAISVLNEQLEAFHEALDRSDDFASFRDNLKEQLSGRQVTRFEIMEARRSIEQRKDEFASPEGLPDGNKQQR